MKLPRLLVPSVAIAVASLAFAATEANPIKKAMQYAHKAPQGQKKISEKIVDGTATDAEVQQTLALYKAATDVKPPKGDAAAFKEKMTKLIAATENVSAHKPGAAAEYKEAVGCKACHSEHKADKK